MYTQFLFSRNLGWEWGDGNGSFPHLSLSLHLSGQHRHRLKAHKWLGDFKGKAKNELATLSKHKELLLSCRYSTTWYSYLCQSHGVIMWKWAVKSIKFGFPIDWWRDESEVSLISVIFPRKYQIRPTMVCRMVWFIFFNWWVENNKIILTLSQHLLSLYSLLVPRHTSLHGLLSQSITDWVI